MLLSGQMNLQHYLLSPFTILAWCGRNWEVLRREKTPAVGTGRHYTISFIWKKVKTGETGGGEVPFHLKKSVGGVSRGHMVLKKTKKGEGKKKEKYGSVVNCKRGAWWAGD